jgi:hypothetical protein
MATFLINYSLELAAFLTGLVLYRKLQPGVFKLLVFLLFITVVNEGFSYRGVYAQIHVKKTLVYAIFFILECTIFWLMFRGNKSKQNQLLYNIIFLLAITLKLFFLSRYGYQRMNSPFLIVVCCYVIFLGINYYYKLYSGEKYFDIKKDPFFWLATGVIIVNCIHLFYVTAIMLKTFGNDPDRVFIFKNLNTIGNIIYYPLLIKALICSSKLQKRATTS